MSIRLTQPLRRRISSIAKEIIAYHWLEGLNHNRLTGAIYHELQNEGYGDLTEQQAVDIAVNLTQRDKLPNLLAKKDKFDDEKRKMAERQVEGIVRNNIDANTPNRDQVIQETLAMLDQFPLVRSITGIQKLVQARIRKGHCDLAEEEADGIE